MVKPTKRDHVWSKALKLAVLVESDEENDLTDKNGYPGFHLEDVKDELEADVADRTIRDCLMSMVQLDVLQVRESRPHKYKIAKGLDEETKKVLAAL